MIDGGLTDPPRGHEGRQADAQQLGHTQDRALEKGAEELRELKTSAALRRLWREGRVKIAFDLDDEPLKFGAREP